MPERRPPLRGLVGPSINFVLDDFDDEYLDRANSSVCPSCGHKVYHESLIVDEEGVFREGEGGEEDANDDFA